MRRGRWRDRVSRRRRLRLQRRLKGRGVGPERRPLTGGLIKRRDRGTGRPAGGGIASSRRRLEGRRKRRGVGEGEPSGDLVEAAFVETTSTPLRHEHHIVMRAGRRGVYGYDVMTAVTDPTISEVRMNTRWDRSILDHSYNWVRGSGQQPTYAYLATQQSVQDERWRVDGVNSQLLRAQPLRRTGLLASRRLQAALRPVVDLLHGRGPRPPGRDDRQGGPDRARRDRRAPGGGQSALGRARAGTRASSRSRRTLRPRPPACPPRRPEPARCQATAPGGSPCATTVRAPPTT